MNAPSVDPLYEFLYQLVDRLGGNAPLACYFWLALSGENAFSQESFPSAHCFGFTARQIR